MTERTTTTTHERRQRADDPAYRPFLNAVRRGFSLVAADAPALFKVSTEGIWNEYLALFPDAERQTYACSACRDFVRNFGGLVTIDDAGLRHSAVWHPDLVDSESTRALDDATECFVNVARGMQLLVEKRQVESVFAHPAGVLGSPLTGTWHHLSADLSHRLGHRNPLLTPGQYAANVRERFHTVDRALNEFSPATLADALRIFEGEFLARAEKFVGPLRWLADLKEHRASIRDHRRRDALLWKAVATAPEGYCHPRTSVIGPLLESLDNGEAFAVVAKKFQAMVAPHRYQRPVAPPTRGNVKRAEEIVATLGVESALARRFARLDEIVQHALWVGKVRCCERDDDRDGNCDIHVAPGQTRPGVFASVDPQVPKRRHARGIPLPAQTMTWTKFQDRLLPTAELIELRVPSQGSFIAITTATDPNAAPIIAWDREDARNPFSIYVYHRGSPCGWWNLSANEWTTVTAIVPRPNLWGATPQRHHVVGNILILQGAVDQHLDEGVALFPEVLRNELREVRATIEAFSNKQKLTGQAEASACGYDLHQEFERHVQLRVWSKGQPQDVTLDRWD